MASVAPSASPDLTRSRILALAVAASALQMLMMIPGYSEDGSFQAGEWLIMLAISLAISVALFLLVVPKAEVTAAIVLGAIALVSVLVFWAGITLPLAAAAAVAGWRVRRSGNTAIGPVVALGLAALATVSLVAIIIGDAVAN